MYQRLEVVAAVVDDGDEARLRHATDNTPAAKLC
jgi:hypothetical protein